MKPRPSPAFQELTGIYEPSAVQQLPDGRFLVVQDEQRHALSLVSIGVDGRIDVTALTPGLLQRFRDFWNLDDLEGLALDRAGFIYAITSHSRDEDGDEKPSRERLVRFRIDDDRVVQPKVVDGLKRALTDQHPVLAAAAQVPNVKAGGGFNIEALEVSPDPLRLLIGFRSPLLDGRALIASIENATAMFEADESPRVAPELDLLDLGGHGIRGLCHVPSLGEYVVIGGPVSRPTGHFDLWLWSGQRGAAPRRFMVSGLPGFERAEGVSTAVIDGVERLIIVSDDGDRKSGRSASYLLLDPGHLQTIA